MLNQTPDVVWPDAHTKAVRRVELAKKRLAAAQAALEQVEKKAEIKCAKCGAVHPIATQTYIQTNWYVEPYGCTGGDYWNQGEANWLCPSCGFNNRFDAVKDKYTTIPNDFYRPEIVALKRFFGKVHECHCSYNQTCENCRKVRESA